VVRQRLSGWGRFRSDPSHTRDAGAPRFLPVGGKERHKQIPFGDDNQKGNSRSGLLFAEDVSHAADLGSNAAEFLFEVFVAAIEVVDAVEDGFAVGDEGCEDE
jgi:hypothetical protein